MALHYVLHSEQEITYLQWKSFNPLFLVDPHKICCIVLGIFTEIVLYLNKIHLIFNDKLAGPDKSFQIGIPEILDV